MRFALWIVRALMAAAAGAVQRVARRWLRRSPRIWHGPTPLVSIHCMVSADRFAGYPSRSVVMTDRLLKYALVTRSDFDFVIGSDSVPWDDRHWIAFVDLLLCGDIWVSYFDGLFFNITNRFRNELAFLLLRLVGIRIIVTAHGSDIVHWSAHRTRYDWIARMQKDYPSWNFDEQTPISLRRIQHFTRHSALVLPGDPVMARLLPRSDLLFKVFPIDCEELRPAPTVSRERVAIVHAPNHRNVKGTDFLLDAVATLQEKGFRCDLILIEGLPRDEALRRYADADIIADQFCMGGWAQFALEGMALGKPVLAYLDESFLEDPVFNIPVVNATKENLPAVLAALIEIPELRSRLGAASRASVERYQSIPALAEVWDRIYRHVWWGDALDFSGTAHFSAERQPRAVTEDPRVEEFWPVPIDDLMRRVRSAIDRVLGNDDQPASGPFELR